MSRHKIMVFCLNATNESFLLWLRITLKYYIELEKNQCCVNKNQPLH